MESRLAKLARQKEYKYFLEVLKAYKYELELAITGARQGVFPHESKNFIINRHNEIRERMAQLEAAID